MILDFRIFMTSRENQELRNTNKQSDDMCFGKTFQRSTVKKTLSLLSSRLCNGSHEERDDDDLERVRRALM